MSDETKQQQTSMPTLSDELKKASEEATERALAQVTGKKRNKLRFAVTETNDDGDLIKSESFSHPLSGTPLAKSVYNSSDDIKRGKEIQRLAFDENPTKVTFLQSLWKPKPSHVLPDHILKQIGQRDSLVATIINTRSNQVSAFGRELTDRFATGFRVEPRPGVMEDATNEQKKLLQKKIAEASKLLGTCGALTGVPWDEKVSLANFMYLQARNGLLFGRFATEILYTYDANNKKTFHSFRPVDAATIYMAAPHQDQVSSVRKAALALLQQLKGRDADKLRPEKFEADEYAFVQVVDGRPIQAFTPEELVVHTLYPVTDLEMAGYPVTPIDNVIDGVATHLNIVQHNKLYFQSGRATRGMVVIKSSDVDQSQVNNLRQHFNASINSVSNAWRVPIFAVDPEESLEWMPLDMQGGRDMEFQYLTDQNAREICSAFHISPEELPGYQHLSRGTNSQALSESSNEYKLEAARDIGIRPLLNQFQDFLNESILPLIDPIVAQLCVLKLYGLDADTAEKEDTRLTAAMQIDLTMDEILERKEKDPIGKEMGGRFLFNPNWQMILDKYFPVGLIEEVFFGREGASKDPDKQYYRDPFWFQYQQLKMSAQQMQMQADQMQQQQQAEAQQQQEAQKPPDNGGDGEQPESELASGADQVLEMMKSEKNLSPDKRRLYHLHSKLVKDTMDKWEEDSKEALAEVLKTVDDHKD